MRLLLDYIGSRCVRGYRWRKRRLSPDDQYRRTFPEQDLGGCPKPWNPLGEKTPSIELCPVGDSDEEYYHPQRESVALTRADSALFRNFAAMTPTQDEILEFVHRYGDLKNFWISQFSEWEYEVRVLKFFVELQDALIKGGRQEIITKNFVAAEPGIIRFPFTDGSLGFGRTLVPISWSGPDPRPVRDEEFNLFRGSAREAAREFLNRVLSHRLVKFRTMLFLERIGKTHDLALRPIDLLSTMWLQFALAVVENKEYRKCESCSRSFELSPEVNRISRYYCSNACRVKAYRGRKAQARRFAKGGKTISQIAETLDSDVPTIKKWLADGGEKEKGPKR